MDNLVGKKIKFVLREHEAQGLSDDELDGTIYQRVREEGYSDEFSIYLSTFVFEVSAIVNNRICGKLLQPTVFEGGMYRRYTFIESDKMLIFLKDGEYYIQFRSVFPQKVDLTFI